jgi:hypothetical protein
VTGTPNGVCEHRRPFSRWRVLRQALVFAVAAFLLWAFCATAQSFYGGTGAVRSEPPEQHVTASVRACTRKGPVSWDGAGYWWTCEVVLPVADGMTTTASLRHSIATGADVGRSVRIREVCSDGDSADCHYGRDVNRAWAIPIALVNVIERLFGAALVIGFLVCILIMIIGRERWDAVRARVTKMSARS